jgi:hypothetical protein
MTAFNGMKKQILMDGIPYQITPIPKANVFMRLRNLQLLKLIFSRKIPPTIIMVILLSLLEQIEIFT